jgi:HNH endonuclease/AP2 domain
MKLTHERLKEILKYDPETGDFIRKIPAAFNKCKAGDTVGGATHNGFLRVSIDGKTHYLHNLAWFYIKSEWTDKKIYHLNGIKTDNRFNNLSESTYQGIDKNNITQEILKYLLNYNPETGIFTCKCKYGKNNIGDIVGASTTLGYISIMLNYKKYLAHRLAWLYVYGVLPDKHLDHIDGIKNNNKITNLREATRSQNQQNQNKAQVGNKSGYLGVSWCNQKKKWKAEISKNRKHSQLGFFNCPKEAHQAYVQAKRELHEYGML